MENGITLVSNGSRSLVLLVPTWYAAVRGTFLARSHPVAIDWGLTLMILVLMLLCLILTGCGAVGDPMPPLLDIPRAPKDLVAVQRGDRILISWPPALLTTEGVAPRPDRLGPVKIYRLVLPDLGSRATEADFKDAKPIAQLESGKFGFEDPIDPKWFNHSVVYAVKLTNRREEAEGFSKLAPTPVLRVGSPPTFRATPQEKAIQLRWTAAASDLFHVYRDGVLLGEVHGGSYDDTQFEFDRAYIYMVRAVTKQGEYTAESADSPTVPLTPVDKFPPNPPLAVRAVAVEAAVEISWSPSTEMDLAGYNIYRGQTKLNKELITNTVFRDAAGNSKEKYHVTAVDTHGNESAPSEEVLP